MARAAHEEITLPWRETVDGAVAELGAIFRVELVGGKWQCTAKDGRCRTVIAKELSSQNEAKRHAQAHAATMPEVRAAAKSRAADAKPGAKKTATRRSKRPDAKPAQTDTHDRAPTSRSPRKSEPVIVEQPGPSVEPREPEVPEPAAPITTLGVTYQTMGDGCLCGKTQGVCWVANGKDVVFARPPPRDVHDRVRDAVMQHYAAEEAARVAAEQAERDAAEQAARRETAAQARASKTAAKKAAVQKIAKASKPAKKVVATKPSRAAVRDAAPARGAKGTQAKPAKDAGAKPGRGRKAGRTRSSKPKPAKGKRNAPKEDASVTTTTTTPTAKRSRKETEAPAAPPGPIAWSDVEGKPRGVAAHGTFLIEPEGQGFALYFADPGGQSRHLRSGAMPELRRAAEEYAARGEPAPLHDAPSREQDEALMRVFAGGAVEGA
ncbi:hypothetical protein [Nannocystis pusilla]|uniref:Uncharacterized protein n=1 Tax=Nannocystis pusilla TaxID=889268 RepID=A0ABS7TJ12_9BACT|nr:hypothetical protein [Nannocystis pusilla]MBZ5708223.1 hypothetical protein [Nannocystis pusilla]